MCDYEKLTQQLIGIASLTEIMQICVFLTILNYKFTLISFSVQKKGTTFVRLSTFEAKVE